MDKRITITIENTDDCFDYNEFKKIVSLAYNSGCRLINVRVMLYKKQHNDKEFISDIFATVAGLRDQYDCIILVALILSFDLVDIGIIRKYKAIVDCIGIMIDDSSYKNSCKTINKIRSLGIRSFMYIDCKDYQLILEKYQKYSVPGIDIETPSLSSYDELLYEDVKKWIYQKDGTSLTVYSNLLTRAILGYSTDCRFSSCISKQVIYSSGSWYSCVKQKKYKLKNAQECSQFADLFDIDEFIPFVKSAIEHRERCKKKCAYYEYCNGGCPFEKQSEQCKYIKYFELIDYTKNEVNNIIMQGSLSNINPYVRNSIFLKMSSYKEV